MGITDYFDGYLARAQGTVSKLGVFLDPIADKIMVAAVILMLVGTAATSRGVQSDRGADHPAARDRGVGPARVPGAAAGVGAGVAARQVEDDAAARRRFGALILAGALPG